MKREETWNKRISSVMRFITRSKRCPSKYRDEEVAMYEWIRYNKRLLRQQKLKAERIKPFLNLMDVVSKYQRLNQYQYKSVCNVPDD